jgi:hypothetical protein
MVKAVASALKAARLGPVDAAAVELVRRYAQLLDAAVPLAKYREHLRVLRAAVADDPAAAAAYAKVADALAEHSVASDLGPKLLAALSALGLTVAGRGSKLQGGGSGDGGAGGDTLDELRARRARRAG